MFVYFVITAQLLYGCWISIQPVQSQTKQTIIRHNLPQSRLELVYGSKNNGSCTNISKSLDKDIICTGTSVLNDDTIPALDGVSSLNTSSWAAELFTLSGENGRIILAFEVDTAGHDRMELAVFNCPGMEINSPMVDIYFDSSFRPDRIGVNQTFGNFSTQSQLVGTSCDRLLIFCVRYNTSEGAPSPTRHINLVFPRASQTNSKYVFLGEVMFLKGGSEPCDQIPRPGPPFISTVPASSGTQTGASSTSEPPNISIIIAVVIVVLLLIVVLAVVIIIIVVVMRLRKYKQKSEVHKLQSVVLETKEDEKEAESYMDNQYGNIINKPPQNGVKTGADSATVMDGLYPNQDEAITDESCSHLQDSQKKKVTPQTRAANGNEYSKPDRERSQTDPVTQKSRPSPAQQEPIDVGMMYAVPDKKKKSSNKAPTVPEKSSELVEYLDSKEACIASNGIDPPEYSEIDAGNNRLSSNVGPVPLSSSAFHGLASNLDSNPIYQPTDIVTAPQSHNGVLVTDAIYSEPLPPNEQEPEWDPDQNIYDAIYSEPLQPSLFMQQRGEVESEDLHPYTSIYTAPIVPTTDKPLVVSYRNIKEIRTLGNGNFGEVVLAQTVGLTPSQLRLEGNATYMLVAVKKLKENASERNWQLFEKEVTFMSRLDHPNVIRLLGVCMDEAAPFIMMEYMANGDLNQYLQRFSMQSTGHEVYSNVKPVEASTLIYMCTQIASGMQYLALQNFIHRDLATRNCLIGLKDTIKVSDFGMSRSLYESQYYVISGHAILPIRWMATECFYGKFSAKTDVWAFGVTMWEIFMLGKEQPYCQLQDREVVEDAIKGADRILLERPSKCPKDVYEIMKKCWIYDASQRPTFDELYAVLSQMNQ